MCFAWPRSLVTCVVFWFVVEGIMYKEPNYTVAIAAVSGLDPTAPDRPALDPEFNLIVVVADRKSVV